jgi:hypothetical protein
LLLLAGVSSVNDFQTTTARGFGKTSAFVLAAFALEPPETRLTFRIKAFPVQRNCSALHIVYYLPNFALNHEPKSILSDRPGTSVAYFLIAHLGEDKSSISGRG